MSELPVTCGFCYEESMVDMDKMERKPLDKINTEVGWVCPKCEGWNVFFKTTPSLDKTMKRLENRNPNSMSYAFHFAKAMMKAERIQER